MGLGRDLGVCRGAGRLAVGLGGRAWGGTGHGRALWGTVGRVGRGVALPRGAVAHGRAGGGRGGRGAGVAVGRCGSRSPAGEAVLDGAGEGVAQVEGAGDVGGWDAHHENPPGVGLRHAGALRVGQGGARTRTLAPGPSHEDRPPRTLAEGLTHEDLARGPLHGNPHTRVFARGPSHEGLARRPSRDDPPTRALHKDCCPGTLPQEPRTRTLAREPYPCTLAGEPSHEDLCAETLP